MVASPRNVRVAGQLPYEIQPFQKPCKPMIAPERMKEWLDCQEVYEICFVIDRFIEALECQIEVFQSDRSQSFCQWSDILACCEPLKFFNAFLGLRSIPLPRVRCG